MYVDNYDMHFIHAMQLSIVSVVSAVNVLVL
jgi:hypothetical protein